MSARILVADDEPDIVGPLEYALRTEGFEVESVGDGESALARALGEPFDLVSRVRAILRRRELDRGEGGSAAVRVGGVSLDFARHQVTADGRAVQLTRSEFRILALLAQSPEQVFSRRQIMEHLWESLYVGDERACDVHISKLRRKLERDPAHPERIVTVRAIGYKLVPV